MIFSDKNPLPEIARSNGRPVPVIEPVLSKFCEIAATSAPPACIPLYTAENSVRDSLKPEVETLAILLLIVFN